MDEEKKEQDLDDLELTRQKEEVFDLIMDTFDELFKRLAQGPSQETPDE